MVNRSDGFTLIELVAAVAIVGILAAIAIPSYQDSVSKSRRADAEGALEGLANKMEQHFTEVNSYCDAGGTGGAAVTNCGTATNDTGSPSITNYTQSPIEGNGTKFYNLTINAAGPTTYTLQATPINAQAGDKCGVLTLNNTGGRAATKNGTAVQHCWE